MLFHDPPTSDYIMFVYNIAFFLYLDVEINFEEKLINTNYEKHKQKDLQEL